MLDFAFWNDLFACTIPLHSYPHATERELAQHEYMPTAEFMPNLLQLSDNNLLIWGFRRMGERVPLFLGAPTKYVS